MKPPAFQFYPDNFIQGVSDMEQCEVGAYILLLCYQWNHGSIPADKPRLERIAHGYVSDHVLAKFRLFDGLLKNERLELEREKQEAYRKTRAENGAKGGRPKAHANHMVLKQEPNGKAYESSPSPSPSPSSDLSLSIREIHEWYSEQMGGGVKMDMATERRWYEWFKAGHESEDFKRVVKHVRDGINAGTRNAGALKLSNLLQPDSFTEDLLIAKQSFQVPHSNGAKSPNGESKDTFWRDTKRLEQVDGEIRAIEGRAAHTALDVIIQPQDKEKYARLKGERKQLKQKMGL